MRSFATIGKAATAFALCATFLASAQIESSIQIFNRGKLWQSVDLGKSGPNFNNWTRRGIGLDWPGFDETLIGENIGGAPSHMVAGGLYVGAEKKPDSVLSVEEWCLYAGSITEGASGKYVVKKHTRVFKDGANHWLASEPEMGEEVVETVWEYNLLHENEYNIERMLPIRVTRRVHQWSGSRAHENYVIHDYVIENIADEIRANVPADRYVADTMYNFYAVLNYGLHCNSRSWAALFPSYTPGARNTWFRYDKRRRLVLGRAADYPLTPEKNEELGRSNSLGMIIDGEPTGEYLAPGFVGVKLLYASPDKTGAESNVGQQGWSAASSTLDLSGPMANIGSAEAQYNALEDIRLAASFVESPFDTTFMRRSRMWSLMRLGPWDIAPGESIRIAWAEIVDGVDYSVAVRPDKNASNTVISQSQDIFYETADKAQLTFDNGFNHPDPPAAPEFRIDFNRGEEDVANVIRWGTETENMPDPDDGTLDLEGVRTLSRVVSADRSVDGDRHDRQGRRDVSRGRRVRIRRLRRGRREELLLRADRVRRREGVLARQSLAAIFPNGFERRAAARVFAIRKSDADAVRRHAPARVESRRGARGAESVRYWRRIFLAWRGGRYPIR